MVVPCVADAPDQIDRLVDLGGRQPRQHLVEQQQARPRRERARELEELGLVQVELAAAARRARASSPVNASQRHATAVRVPPVERARRRTSRVSATLSRTLRCANGRGIW